MNVATKSKTTDVKRMFLPYQVARIKDESRFKLDEKARRIGLTFAYGWRFTKKRAAKPGKTWYTANDTGTVLEFIDYIAFFAKLINSAFDVIDDEVVDEKNGILAKVVKFKDAGKVIGLSSNPIALHGKGGDVIGDEFAYHDHAQTMWEAMQATAGWGDEIVMLSTHTSEESEFNGHIKDAKKLYAKADELGIGYGTEQFRKLALSMQLVPWSYRRVTIHDAVEQGLVEKINETKNLEFTREDFLAECRAKCRTEEQWKRQYLCEPSSDSTALLPYRLILTCVEDKCLADLVDAKNDVFQGMDIGRHNDPTAIISGEKVGDVIWTRDIKRLENIKFRDQLSAAAAIIKLPQFRRGCYDQTGMGEMPIEELQLAYGEYKISGIKFNNDIKAEMALALRRAFEDRTIRIPRDQKLFDSLNKIRSSTTSTGKTQYDAASDDEGHADEFWALAMMNWASCSKKKSTGYEHVEIEGHSRISCGRRGALI
jgi:phage FluMu gp28-like protein